MYVGFRVRRLHDEACREAPDVKGTDVPVVVRNLQTDRADLSRNFQFHNLHLGFLHTYDSLIKYL